MCVCVSRPLSPLPVNCSDLRVVILYYREDCELLKESVEREEGERERGMENERGEERDHLCR